MTNSSNILNLIGLIINTGASLILLISYLNITRNVNDDYIIKMDDKGNYTQIKHLKDKMVGLLAFTLYSIGFCLQFIAIIIN